MKPKLSLFFLLMLLLASCGKDDETDSSDPNDPSNPNNPPVVVDMLDLTLTTITFNSDKDASLVVVKTNSNWKATCAAEWIELSAEAGNKSTGFLIGAQPNKNFSRETVVTITAGDKSKDIKIIQKGVTKIEFEINGVTFRLLPVEADVSFQLDGATYFTSRSVYLDSYFISETEITNEQWMAVMGELPYEDEDNYPNLPVVVNWNDITQKFIPAINEQTGLQLRLPTENEWEVAARGGKLSNNTAYAGSIYIDEVAWYWNNAEGNKHPVGLKLPNELGLYDMSGNVSEWCSDWYQKWTESTPPPAESTNPTGPSTGSEKVIRGGDFVADHFEWDRNSCRIDSRNYLPPGIDTPNFNYEGFSNYTGFRLVLAKDK